MSTPGILTITATGENVKTPSGTVANTVNGATLYIGKVIPHQTIIWRGYRVECDTAAHALAQRNVYVNIPWLGATNLTDGLPYQNALVVPLDNAIVTLKTEMTSPLALSIDIPQQFSWYCTNRDGSAVDATKVLSVQLFFSYGATTTTGF